MVDIYANEETTLNLANQFKGEVAFVIVKGEITENDHKVEAGQMLISKTDEQCVVFVWMLAHDYYYLVENH